MPQPYDYSLNVPNPAQALQQGLQTGVSIGEVQAQSQLRNQQAQALQAKAQRTQQFQQALVGLGANPSAKQLSGLLVQFPEMSDMFKESYNRISGEEQRERISQASSVYAATLAGDTELAKKQLTEYATAYRNAGREEDAKALEANAKLIELHPEAAERSISLWLATQMGPEKFAESFGKLQDQRRETALEKSNLTIKEKQAEQEVIKSKFAESQAVAELNLKAEQIRNLSLEPEFKRANLKILALQAEAAKESNKLKQDEIKSRLEDAKLARDEKLRTRVFEARKGAADIKSFIASLNEVLAQPAGFFSAANSATGPVASKLLTVDSRTADFEEMIEGLKSKAFLSKIADLRGTGAISNIEGEKAQNALGNLSLRQDDKLLFKNLRIARESLLKMYGEIEGKFGVDVGPVDAADPNSDEVNALVGGANTGGATARY